MIIYRLFDHKHLDKLYPKFDTLAQDQLYTLLRDFCFTDTYESTFYPGCTKWLKRVICDELLRGNRAIILACDGDDDYFTPVGVTIVKRDPKHPKVCTLMVNQRYTHMHVGSTLLKKAIEYLGVPYPQITINALLANQYAFLFEKFNFKEVARVTSLYHRLDTEVIYNDPYVQ